MATKKITVTQPKEGQPPTETLVLQWLLEPETVNVSTTSPSSTAVEGSTLLIDDEYMIVTDASAPDRLVVKRGAFETEIVEHAEGVQVLVWGEPADETLPGKHPLLKDELRGYGATIKRQQPQEGSDAMPTAEDQKNQTQPRGAGSGKLANATRRRNPEDTLDKNLDFAEGKSAESYKPEAYEPGPEFEEGDATKGKLDYRTTNDYDPNKFIPIRDRRAYLLDQAAKNESVNDELNAMQVRQNANVQMASNLIHDPDYQRDLSMESAMAELEMHDPDKRAEALKGEMDARRKREEQQQQHSGKK